MCLLLLLLLLLLVVVMPCQHRFEPEAAALTGPRPSLLP
jgi:hypothetical protein